MFTTRINYELKDTKGKSFFLRRIPIEAKMRRLEKFLESEPELCTFEYARDAMFSFEIKANNRIEGYGDDIETIGKVITGADAIRDESKKTRILNLYHAYRYILEGHPIDKESARKLYEIVSKDALDEFAGTHMGEYYRADKVYIMGNEDFGLQIREGVPVERLDEFMDMYFEFLNEPVNGNETEKYIKSQILHYYFVYVHPYFDVNGRTSRTLAMWYLLNEQVYPYIIFNRGIAFQRSSYSKAIMKTTKSSNLTHFVSFMLDTVRTELEKEYVIRRVREHIRENLDETDYQTLLYFLSLHGTRSIRSFVTSYNGRTNRDMKSPTSIYEEMLVPALEKGILDIKEVETDSQDALEKKVLVLRPVDLDPNKTKTLHI